MTTTLLAEIQSKCNLELLASRDHDAIAAVVNKDRIKVVPTLGGIGTVLETLGPVGGSELLDNLEAMASVNSAVKWAFVLINRGELDFGSAATRGMIDMLVPGPAGAALKAVAEQPDHLTPARIANILDGGE